MLSEQELVALDADINNGHVTCQSCLKAMRALIEEVKRAHRIAIPLKNSLKEQNQKLRAELEAARTALEYCAAGPFLSPENQATFAVAQDALRRLHVSGLLDEGKK